MDISLKVKMVARWLFGHTILIEYLKNMNTNLMNIWYVFVDNILLL